MIVVLMVCNGLVTALAMARYTQRQTQPEAKNGIQAFLDENYDDDFMEKRWPNMVIAE